MAVKALAHITGFNVEDDGDFHVELNIAAGVERSSGVQFGPYNPSQGASAVNDALKAAVQGHCETQWEMEFDDDTVALLTAIALI